MTPFHATRRLTRVAPLAALALAVASCGQQPPAENRASTVGKRVWTKFEEKLDEADARRALTKENFAKIRDGMTLQEVVNVLGVKLPTKQPDDTGCWITWEGAGRKVIVFLSNGKVRSKQQEGLD